MARMGPLLTRTIVRYYARTGKLPLAVELMRKAGVPFVQRGRMSKVVVEAADTARRQHVANLAAGGDVDSCPCAGCQPWPMPGEDERDDYE